MPQVFERLWKDEEAPTAVEYGILVSLIAAVIIGTVRLFGEAVVDLFSGLSAVGW